jgi:hypothetical protein
MLPNDNSLSLFFFVYANCGGLDNEWSPQKNKSKCIPKSRFHRPISRELGQFVIKLELILLFMAFCLVKSISGGPGGQ